MQDRQSIFIYPTASEGLKRHESFEFRLFGLYRVDVAEGCWRKANSVNGVDIYNDKIKEFLGHDNLNFIKCDIRNPGFNIDEIISDADVVIDLIAYANPGLV